MNETTTAQPRGRVCLTRGATQAIVIGEGDDQIVVTLGKGTGNRRKIVVDAPRRVKVMRAEIAGVDKAA